MQREVEAALRAVLHKDNKLKSLKIKTGHFLIDCEMKVWAAAKKLTFEENGVEVPAYPEMILITVHPKPGRRSSPAYQAIKCGSKKDGTNIPVASFQKEHITPKKIAKNLTAAPNISRNSRNKTSSTPNNVTTPQKESAPDTISDDVSDTKYPRLSKSQRTRKSDRTYLKSRTLDTESDSSSEEEPYQTVPKFGYISVAKKRETMNQRSKAHVQNSEKSDSDSEESDTRNADTRGHNMRREKDDDKASEVEQSSKNATKSRPKAKSQTSETLVDVCNKSTSKKTHSPPNIRRKFLNKHKFDAVSRSSAEFEASDGQSSRGSSVSDMKCQRERRKGTKHSFHYSLRKCRKEQILDRDIETESNGSKEPGSHALEKSNRQYSSEVKTSKLQIKTKCKATSDVEKVNTRSKSSLVNQASDNDSDLRRSKRLKILHGNDSPPAKRMKEVQDRSNFNNNNNGYTTVANTGTQTRGSTYRIKNSDLKLVKKLAVPGKVDSQQNGQRPRRVLNTYPSTNEGIGTRSTNREPLCYQRDRTLIQQEELAEEMKLQQMALTSNSQSSKPFTRSSENGQKKRRSLIMSTFDSLIKPIKCLFK